MECPKCGDDNIYADITASYIKVPLSWDGFSPSDGEPAGNEMDRTYCGSCGVRVHVLWGDDLVELAE